MPLAWASGAAGCLAGWWQACYVLHAAAEVHCELRAGPWGGRPCAQGLPASPEQAKPWEPGEECILRNRMVIFGCHTVPQTLHAYRVAHPEPFWLVQHKVQASCEADESRSRSHAAVIQMSHLGTAVLGCRSVREGHLAAAWQASSQDVRSSAWEAGPLSKRDGQEHVAAPASRASA